MFTQEAVSALVVVAGAVWLLLMGIAIYNPNGYYISSDDVD